MSDSIANTLSTESGALPLATASGKISQLEAAIGVLESRLTTTASEAAAALNALLAVATDLAQCIQWSGSAEPDTPWRATRIRQPNGAAEVFLHDGASAFVALRWKSAETLEHLVFSTGDASSKIWTLTRDSSGAWSVEAFSDDAASESWYVRADGKILPSSKDGTSFTNAFERMEQIIGRFSTITPMRIPDQQIPSHDGGNLVGHLLADSAEEVSRWSIPTDEPNRSAARPSVKSPPPAAPETPPPPLPTSHDTQHAVSPQAPILPQPGAAVTTRCVFCGHAMPSTARFCAQCGKPRDTGVCPRCGQPLTKTTAKFCGHCGAPVA